MMGQVLVVLALVALLAVVVAVTLLASPAWRRTVASRLRTSRSR